MIQEAMRRGDFEGLPGKGKPLELDAYFETPEDVRMAHSVLKNAGLAPLEIDLLQDITALREKLDRTLDEQAKRGLRQAMAAKRLHLDMMLERAKRQPNGG
jgi:ABC-type amino acid transport substrate-binding protein